MGAERTRHVLSESLYPWGFNEAAPRWARGEQIALPADQLILMLP